MERSGSSRLRPLLIVVALVAAGYLLRGWWLPSVGWVLVRDEGPARADAALVLAGDYSGGRILHAAGLVRRGFVPVVLVSGPAGFYGHHESEPAIAFAVAHGCPAEWFVPLEHTGLSTAEEARQLYPELRRRALRRVLLVTSNFHSARAARIFRGEGRRAGAPIELRVVAAPDQTFDPDHWWQTSESRKTIFFEGTKTLATALGW